MNRPSFRPSLPLQLILLAAVILAAYSPALFAEPSILDDASLLKSWQNAPQIQVTELFRNSGGFYYRPMIGLLNWIEKAVFGLNPIAMHGINLLLHILNSFIVYLIIRSLLRTPQQAGWFLPLLGALLFGLHPITTESVNWISGRTDILAATGLLGAALCIVLWHQHRKPYFLLFAGATFMLGLLTKETAWGFLPAIPLLLWPQTRNTSHSRPDNSPHPLVYAAGLCIALAFLASALTVSFWPALALAVICWGLFHYLATDPAERSWKRSALFTVIVAISLFAVLQLGLYLCNKVMLAQPFSRTGRALLNMLASPDRALQATSMTAAFYIKKFFFPLPLSLSITTINPNYIWGGILLLFSMAFLCARRTLAAAFTMSGICLLIPALPLIYGTIAWTPYAERYVYIPAAFWVVALILVTGKQRQLVQTALHLLLVIVITVSAFVTFSRSQTWQSNVTLFADSAQKAPDHLETQGIYMIALALDRQLNRAREQHQKIQALATGPVAMKYDYNYAYLAYWSGLTDEADNVLVRSLERWHPVAGPHVRSLYTDEWRKLHEVHLRLAKDLGRPPVDFTRRK